jgi:hypothetical protein
MEVLDRDFKRRVDQIGERIRALDPEVWPEVRFETLSEDSVEWTRGDLRATLILHRADAQPHLSLTLLAGEGPHPDAMGIGVDDDDLVEMLAQPIAALLAERGAEHEGT